MDAHCLTVALEPAGAFPFMGICARHRTRMRSVCDGGGRRIRRLDPLLQRAMSLRCAGSGTTAKSFAFPRNWQKICAPAAAVRHPLEKESFRAYRLDEVLGDWNPFFDVLKSSIQRTCKGSRPTCRW